MDVVFSNAVSGRSLTVDYVIIPTMLGNRTVQAEGSGTVFDRGAENGGAGGSSFDRGERGQRGRADERERRAALRGGGGCPGDRL